MSMVAAVKGYRMLVVMPDRMSGERLAISRAFGAQVMTLGDFHVNDTLANVAELGRKPGILRAQLHGVVPICSDSDNPAPMARVCTRSTTSRALGVPHLPR